MHNQSKIKVLRTSQLFKKDKYFTVGRYHSLKLNEPYNSDEIKITMSNGKIVLIDLGLNNKASIVMDDILDLSAVGSDYNVYNISSINK